MTIFEGMHFGVEWQGREITVFVSYEVVQDLGDYTGRQTDTEYQRFFGNHRGKVLDVAVAVLRAGRIDRHGRVHLTAKDFFGLVPTLSIST